MHRTHRAVAVLAAAFFALHIPFLPASLEDLDSINFALGLRDFDVAAHQPHPPGYPVFILAGKILRTFLSSEAQALSVLSIVSASLGVFALAALYRRIDPERASSPQTMAATALVAAAPLYWFTASRPLSDAPGLAAAIGTQALALSGGSNLLAAAFLAGIGGGIRSQVLFLTVPLIAWVVVRSPASERASLAMRSLGLFVAGALVWFVPMLIVEGGPANYWRALSSQGTEDLSGVQMLWTNQTPRQVRLVLESTFIAPWAHPVLAGFVLLFALAGLLVLARRARPALAVIIAGFGPYFVFDVLFQESITTRYALPLVVPTAYLAGRGAMALPRWPGVAAVVALAGFGAAIGQQSILQFVRLEAPAFRLLRDMREAERPGTAQMIAMHRREDLDFRRPIAWVGDGMPASSGRLPAPPKREWLEAVKYWNNGGRAPVWFVADPLRSDLALIDHRAPPRTYRWGLPYMSLIGGARPNEMDWYVFDRPEWYVAEGWALTPEAAGVAVEDRRGPGLGGIDGWVRRQPGTVTIMIGGRNLTGAGTPASVRVALDGRVIDEASVAPGFFLRMLTVPEGGLQGQGGYATLHIAARGEIAIEQFDAQPPERLVFGYGEGWHEREYDPIRGQVWRWMSDRGTLRIRSAGAAHRLSLEGVTETFSRPSRVVIRAGERVIADLLAGSTFSISTTVPAELLPAGEATMTIETDQVYVPAERSSRTQDRRRLGLKVHSLRLDPVR